MTLPLNTPIRLKGEYPGVYNLAPEGGVGYARKRAEDNGYSMIYVEWDKSHWSYSGEQDMWTFEEHFELVDKEEEMSEPDKRKLPPGLRDEMQEMLEEILEQYGSGEEEEEKADEPLVIISTPEEHAELAEQLEAFGQRAEAFVLFGVRKIDKDGDIALSPFALSSYKDAVAGIFLETQISQFSASAFTNVAVELMNMLKEQRD